MPKTITIKAPVGPPICTRLPPKADIKNPAITAVISPCTGVTPEAMAKAIDNGKATIPTMIPAKRSLVNNSTDSPISYFDSFIYYMGVIPSLYTSQLRYNSQYIIAAYIIQCIVVIQKLTYFLMLVSFAVVYLKKSLNLQITDEMNPEKQKKHFYKYKC